ncbi:MAG: DUF1566 domain-containing protein [Desulfobacterales bacterium]|nr:DUF1566 domain-containing protein [Desulfobacterales bacterium]
MGNFFSKKWVTIFFICFIVFGFAAIVNAQVRCYLCNDNPDSVAYPREYWLQNPASCPGGQSSSGSYYDTRAGYSCNQGCSNSESTCDYPNKKVCFSNGTTDPYQNRYNLCAQIVDYKCLWTRNASAATADPATWEHCDVNGYGLCCEMSNWYNDGGKWGTWPDSGDSECATCSETPNLPTSITAIVSDITTTSAISGGNVISNGGDSVTARGTCWNTSQSPTLSDTCTANSTGTGSFTSIITGLSPDTTYYVRAYATNSIGTSYGNEVLFQTSELADFSLTKSIDEVNGHNVFSDIVNLQDGYNDLYYVITIANHGGEVQNIVFSDAMTLSGTGGEFNCTDYFCSAVGGFGESFGEECVALFKPVDQEGKHILSFSSFPETGSLVISYRCYVDTSAIETTISEFQNTAKIEKDDITIEEEITTARIYKQPALVSSGTSLPDTGQTQSYTDTFGEDSDYTINPPSYTKLDAQGNELPYSDECIMVRDNITGLIWEVKKNDGSIHDKYNTYTWYDSNPETNGGYAGTPGNGTDTEDFINTLNSEIFGGFSDWRLPTINELASVANCENFRFVINSNYFPDIMSPYFSSTTYSRHSSYVWSFGSTSNGGFSRIGKAQASYVLAVRGENRSSNHFIINSDNTITDTDTGLIWQMQTADSAMSWEEAIVYCENLSLAGYNDWRLPNIRELKSIVDYSRYDPAIDVEFFPDTLSSAYWSSSTGATHSGNAWHVNFGSLTDTYNNKSNARYVRAVRGGQNRLSDHLVILAPNQGSIWEIGNSMFIIWQPHDIPGEVRISISREGGKDGTYEPIVEQTENDGIYEWKVSESSSTNCMLKIEPLSDPSKETVQGPFTITYNTQGISPMERNALIDLYSSTDGDNWTNNGGWLGDPGTECNWYGVKCDTGQKHVVEIDLSENKLTGSISSELGSLSTLKELNLKSNDLAGSIPSELGNLASLEHLILNNNQLTGEIPSELMKLTNLVKNESDFRYNALSTSDPALNDFLNTVQIGGDWESTQNITVTLPIVTTSPVSSIVLTSAITGGDVTSDGGAPVTGKGVCWNTSSNPTIDDHYTTDGTGEGGFSSIIEGLNPDTTYYSRAYVTNKMGTAYGEEVYFKTGIAVPETAIIDKDAESLIADGISIVTITITIKDGLEQPVPDGTMIQVTTDLGEIKPYSYKTENGQITCHLKASLKLGTANILVKYGADLLDTTQVDMLSGPIDRLVLTTPSQTVSANSPSSFIQLQTQDAYGHPVAVDTYTIIQLSSTSGNSAQFYTIDPNSQSWIWSGSDTLAILKPGNHTLLFKYRDSKTGPWTILASEPPYKGWHDGSLDIDIVEPPLTEAIIQNAPNDYTSDVSSVINIGGESVTAYKYRLDTGAYSTEQPLSNPITLVNLTEGSHNLYVIGKSELGNWQSEENATIASWFVDTTRPSTSAIPAGNIYKSAQEVSLSCNDGSGSGCAVIYYTIDETEPTTFSTEYSTPIFIDKDTTLKFFSVDKIGNTEVVKEESYFFDQSEPSVVITSPQHEAWVRQGFAIQGTASDPSGEISVVELQIIDMNSGSYLTYAETSKGLIYYFDDTQAWVPAIGTDQWQFDSTAVRRWGKNTPYTIQARVTDKAGNSAMTSPIKFTYGDEIQFSTITCELSKDAIFLGEPLEISGIIKPSPAYAARDGAYVDVELISPDGEIFNKPAHSNINGYFSYNIACQDITFAGMWTVQTKWQGIGNEIVGSGSEIQTFEVMRAESRVTLDVTSQSVKGGETISLSGRFFPNPNCGRDFSNIDLTLIITPPDNNPEIRKTFQTGNSLGQFLTYFDSFNKLGIWTFKVIFDEDEAYSFYESEPVKVRVVETAGYAIIVQGKSSGGEGIKDHNKTTQFVYKTLKNRDLPADDIMYFNYDINQEGVSGTPLKKDIEDAITGWAMNKMNAYSANLYIVMVNHGTEDQFSIYPGSITASDLSYWLDRLQSGLNDKAANQEIIVTLGFCHSGSFIKELSGTNRVIIASTAHDENSYRGVEDVEDGIRDGEYFVSEFFRGVSFGKSVKECFEHAVELTEIYTSSGSGILNYPYYDDAQQHPLLDDNGDGVGSNDLGVQNGDGQFSEELFIGISRITENAPGDISITEVSNPIFLGESESSVEKLWARVDDINRLDNIWAEVKKPNPDFDLAVADQRAMVLPKIFTINYNEVDKRFEWYDLNCNGKECFEEPGNYQVFYFAKDIKTGNISSLMETSVYKNMPVNTPPDPFSLVLPADGAEVLTTTILDWEHATDPDGDSVSYTVLLAEGDPTAIDTNPTIRKKGLSYSACLISPADGIKDRRVYYWKVQAIDRYGAVRETGVRVFHTNNNNVATGWIRAYVYDSSIKPPKPVTNAYVTIGTISLESGSSGGYFLGEMSPGEYTAIINAIGYRQEICDGVVVEEGKDVTRHFELVPDRGIIIGDIDGNNIIEIADAISGLQILSGIIPLSPFYKEADTGRDDKIGLEDVIYILQKISVSR